MPSPSIPTLPAAFGSAPTALAKTLTLHDPRSLAVLRDVERLGCSDATVLIVGETGTGKELFARHLHAISKRRGPFVAVNCGAIAESIIDAELFGYEAGAFTGATGARAGWFEAAHGGTLFLDEIGDLSLHLQVKLLRVLQERQVVRLGSRRALPIDVRLVAATNVDLRQAVDAQRFRADLYYRLNVAPVQVPALRERPGDILALAHYFVALYSERLGLRGVTIADDAQAALLAYTWPGNIRELENAIHFGLIVCRNARLRAADLKLVPILPAAALSSDLPVPAQMTSPGASRPTADDARVDAVPMPAPRAAPAAATTPAMAPPHATLYREIEERLERLMAVGEPSLLARIEQLLVRTAYARSASNQVRTAQVLGITRNALRTLLKRHLGPGIGKGAQTVCAAGTLNAADGDIAVFKA